MMFGAMGGGGGGGLKIQWHILNLVTFKWSLIIDDKIAYPINYDDRSHGS